MGFFKPADDAEESEDAPVAGDEGAAADGDDTGTVGFADDEGGDALAGSGGDEAGPSDL